MHTHAQNLHSHVHETSPQPRPKATRNTKPRAPLTKPPLIQPRLRSFVSDIGAHALKPVFMTGCTLTALTFVATMCSVHYARHSPNMHVLAPSALPPPSRWRKAVSGVSLLCGLLACTALTLLTVYDTYRFHAVHGRLLLLCFGGLALCMLGTTLVWWDVTWGVRGSWALRRW